MASWLATGEGASAGLEQVLERMMAEQLQQRQLQEQSRHNTVNEGLEGRRIDEQSADRRLREQERADTRSDANKTREEANILRRVALRPIGADVAPEEKAGEVAHGIPIGNYNFTPANMGRETVTGEEVPATSDSLKWRGTEDQIIRSANAGGQQRYEQKSGKLDGKPVDYDYDPKTGRAFYRGQDVTNRIEHYEKPPAPDRVLIQTGGGYETREDARRRLAAGGTVPLATTSQTRAMSEGAKMLEPHVQQQRDMAEKLDEAGLFGPVMGRIRQALQKAGTIDEFSALIGEDPELNRDRLSGKFATSLGLLATGAGRVHGGARGGGSPQMYEHFKAMLQDASTLQMFEGRLDALDSYMQGYAAGPGGAASRATPPASGNVIRYNMQGQVIK